MLEPLTQIAIITLASFASQWVAWRVKIPAIVFLLAVGFFVGPITGMVVPDKLMGDLLQPFIGVAVAIILFEGSLQLRFAEIREVRRTVLHVVIAGATIGWLLMALAAHSIGGLSWPVAVVFSGLLIVTGPTVIMPLLRHSKIKPRTGSILKWEGIINDPVGVIAAVIAYEFFILSEGGGGFFFLEMVVIIAIIVAFSYGIARLSVLALEKALIPEYLKAPFLISVVITLFIGCNAILHESGLIAVTVLGMTLTNIHMASLEEIRKFKETVSVLLISGVFIILTANLSPAALMQMDFGMIVLVLMIVFVIRPITMMLASIGTNMSRNEVILIGWLAPRGIVCAALAGVMGPLLVSHGYEDGAKVLPLAFSVVLLTVVAHGLTAKKLAQKLDLAVGKADGLLIIGATDWTIQFAGILKEHGVPVLIADKKWQHLKAAKQAQIDVYYGEILSEEAQVDVEMNRFGMVLAATGDHAYNAMVCNEFATAYSREKVFQVASTDMQAAERKKLPISLRGRIFVDTFFDADLFARRYADGWQFVTRAVGVEEEKSASLPGADKADEQGVVYPEHECALVAVISKSKTLTIASHEEDDLPSSEGSILITFERPELEE